jgi:hypothetical protein
MTKTSITTIALSILALIVAVVGFTRHSETLVGSAIQGSLIDQDVRVMPFGEALGNAGTSVRGVQAISLSIGTGANQASWLNTTGQTVYFGDYVGALVAANGSTTALASTTLSFSVSTSTKSAITDVAAPFVSGSLLNDVLIATGTTPSSITLNSDTLGGTGAAGWLAVPNNTYAIAVLEQPYQAVGSAYGNATSTNRGYNISGTAEVYSF